MAVTFSDDFNRADALLSASADWTEGIAGNNRVLSNEVALSSLSGFDATSLADATMPDDQYVKMTVTARGGTVDTWPGLMARYTAFGDLYFLQVRCDSTANGDTAQLYKKVSGGFTSLGGPTAITVTIPFTMELRCVGTTISTYIGGVEIHSVTDTSHSSGKVGIYNSAQSGSAPLTNTLRLDDFEAGSPGAAPSGLTTKVGTTDVATQYVGSTPVLRAYVGTNLVFGSAP